MKNKKLIIYLAIGIIILIGAAVLFTNKKTASNTVIQTPPEEKVVTMKPEEIGMSLTLSSDNKDVIFGADKTQGITSLDYELSYTAKGDIPRGVMGHIDIKESGQKVSQKITLGTCSDVCHYDEDVSNIKLMVKIAKTDGTTAQVEKALN